jgi:hypothetical protein
MQLNPFKRRSPRQILQWLLVGNAPGVINNCKVQLYSLRYRLFSTLPPAKTQYQRVLSESLETEFNTTLESLIRINSLLAQLKAEHFPPTKKELEK